MVIIIIVGFDAVHMETGLVKRVQYVLEKIRSHSPGHHHISEGERDIRTEATARGSACRPTRRERKTAVLCKCNCLAPLPLHAAFPFP